MVVNAAFTLDGHRVRVKSVLNGNATLFAGAGCEIKNPDTGKEFTKYYFAGASRVAKHEYVMLQWPTVHYMLYNHVGSTKARSMRMAAPSATANLRADQILPHWAGEAV